MGEQDMQVFDSSSRVLTEGFDGYLSKPIEQRELINEMKRVMSLTFYSHKSHL